MDSPAPARTAQLRVDGIPGSQAGAAAEEIAKLTPEGGTNLGDALDLAYETALHHYLAKGDNRVVLLTDGAANLKRLLTRLPSDIPLGLYECPAPYRRLLSDEELKMCIDTGRFIMLKDVSCDLDTVKRRVALAQGSPTQRHFSGW